MFAGSLQLRIRNAETKIERFRQMEQQRSGLEKTSEQTRRILRPFFAQKLAARTGLLRLHRIFIRHEI